MAMAKPKQSKPATPQSPAYDEQGFTDLYTAPNWDCSELDFGDEEWACPATDSKGHSLRETVRMPPSMHRAIEIIVASKKFPYKTPADFLRHAAYRHLFMLHRRATDIPRHLLVACESIMQTMRDEQQILAMRQSIEATVKTCSQHAADGNVQGVLQCISLVKSQVNQLPKQSIWRKRFLEEFQSKLAGFRRTVHERAEEANVYRPSTYSSTTLPPQMDPDQHTYDE